MTDYKSRLHTYYEEQLIEKLVSQFKLKNKLEAPKLAKIVVSMGVKEAAADSKAIERAVEVLMRITGQKPVVTRAKKAIAAFKLKSGVPIGCKVTLRRKMMYDFLDRLINIALPRVRDFRGLNPKSFDGQGNFAMGLKEHTIFPEISADTVEKPIGMNIVFTIKSNSDVESLELLKLFNLPFIN